eukprot:4445886-Prymnesium_polylepis.1
MACRQAGGVVLRGCAHVGSECACVCQDAGVTAHRGACGCPNTLFDTVRVGGNPDQKRKTRRVQLYYGRVSSSRMQGTGSTMLEHG